jgi:RNA polymerase sigma-54 factor
MKPRLSTSLGQHLVMTPQLRQAIRLLQLSSAELELEIAEAVESNPLLDWDEPATLQAHTDDAGPQGSEGNGSDHAEAAEWDTPIDEHWSERLGPVSNDDDDTTAEQVAEPENLQDHLLWQLHLSPLSPRDRSIGVALVEAIDEDGYLRESLESIAESLLPELVAEPAEILTVLHQLQRFDPVGVGARSLGECLQLQLAVLPPDTPARALATLLADDNALERLPRIGIEGLARDLHRPVAEVEAAVQLLRTLEPRPGARLGGLAGDTYVVPDCVVWRQQGQWRVALSAHARPRINIHRGYERMIRSASEADASYLRGRLQEARWLLKSLEARGDTLLKVMRCLLRQQSAFLEFGDEGLRPLTLREVAGEVGLHESTISRAIARKYVRTPRGTIALRTFFASGIETGGGGEASSTAIQAMIRRLIDGENPRKPLSDARLADSLRASGVPVARRTVAKYREAMSIPSSQDRVRIG